MTENEMDAWVMSEVRDDPEEEPKDKRKSIGSRLIWHSNRWTQQSDMAFKSLGSFKCWADQNEP